MNMAFAVRHAMDFENMLNSPGWKALTEKAVEDIAEKQELLLQVESLADMRELQGYIKAIKTLMNFPSGMIESAALSEEVEGKRLESRRQVAQLVK
jgi:hypothetical protein